MKDVIQKFRAIEKKEQLIVFLIYSTFSNFFVGVVKFIYSLIILSLGFFINAGFSFVLTIYRLLTIRKYSKIKIIKDKVSEDFNNLRLLAFWG